MTPTDELLKLPFLHLDQVKDSLHAYQLSKRGNSLRVMAESVHWGKRGARMTRATLTDFGTPVIDWAIVEPQLKKRRATVRAASLVRDNHEPGCADVEIRVAERSTRWLFAESWWAESFPGARFSGCRALGTGDRPVGDRIALCETSFAGRGAQTGRPHSLGAQLRQCLDDALGRIAPESVSCLDAGDHDAARQYSLPQLQTVLSRLQSPIAASLGDSYMLVSRPIEAAAIQTKIDADLKWLAQRCERIAVIAHSQGAASAARVVANAPDYKGLLITFGSGLRKLEELESLADESWIARGAWFTVGGVVFAAIADGRPPTCSVAGT